MGGIPLEIVAAITAVLSAVLDTTPDQLAIRAIAAEPPPAGAGAAWSVAGRLEQHMARRQWGLRAR